MEALPIWVVPLLVTSEIVASKDFIDAIAFSKIVRSADVRVKDLLAVPADHDLPVKVRYVVDPFRTDTW